MNMAPIPMHAVGRLVCRLGLVFVLLPAAYLVTACATLSAPQSTANEARLDFGDERFGPPPDLISPYEIFRLTGEQKRRFERYFYDPVRAGVPAHERVFSYLDAVTADYSFQGDTLTASETLERSSGNCLSLANLTTALADVAGVEIAYQLMDSAPVFQSEGDVIYKGVHARSILYDPDWVAPDNVLLVRRPGITVDYFPSGAERFIGNLPKNEFVSMYYNNLAADAVASGDLSHAYWLLRKSLEYAPKSAGAVNMMAVLFRRAGDPKKAEEIYRYGIEHLPDKVSLLRNYRILLTQQGRTEEADAVAARLERLSEPNPFDWIHAAEQAHEEGHYREALKLYKKAVAIAPYLHESYFGMARSHYLLGDHSSAESELQRAIERAHPASVRTLYHAKLTALRGYE